MRQPEASYPAEGINMSTYIVLHPTNEDSLGNTTGLDIPASIARLDAMILKSVTDRMNLDMDEHEREHGERLVYEVSMEPGNGLDSYTLHLDYDWGNQVDEEAIRDIVTAASEQAFWSDEWAIYL